MLRNFLLVLLLINLGILAWYHWLRETDEGAPIAPSYEGLPSLALVEKQPLVEPGPQVFSMKTGQELLDAGVSDCRSIGPFEKTDDADDVTLTLLGQDYAVSTRSTPGRLFIGFWVNIAAADDRAAAEVITDALRADGVTDFYIVPSGDDQYAISLGVFSELGRAQRRLQQLSDRGFEAQVNQRYKDGEVSWLDVSGFGVDKLNVSALAIDARGLEILGQCPPR
ncbi:MAG: SPOR domain-containing protein [Gammaproteobacteria bacterium]|nr:SPOR domain-containing protein [Gammaproteobacteria bacterium]